jgi:hypothetical protein
MHRTTHGSWWVICFALWAQFCAAQTGDRIVELEVKFPGAEASDQQAWAEVLSEVGVDRLRMTSAEGARPAVSESEFRGQRIVSLVGVLDRSGQLALPGGKFAVRDGAKIRALIAQLRADGAQVTLAEKMAFGLTAEQLVSVSESLAGKIDFETKGQRIGDVVDKLRQALSVPVVIDADVQSQLGSDEMVQEELKGLAAGTVLAAAIRPLGLVAVPRRAVGKSIELSIVDSRASNEHWPIGWPSETTPGRTAPKLFERKNFDLTRAPLSDALNAIEQRIGLPMIYDRNALERAAIELSEIRVTLKREKQTYFAALEDILGQARPRLKAELRVDEAQQPFLWISTSKP